MPFIHPLYANATFVITRAGDLDPYTTSFGLGYSPDGFDPAEADSLAAAFRTASLPSLSTAEVLVSIDWQYNDGDGTLQYISALNSTGTGGTAAALVPQNVSHLLLKRTALPGRRGRGRMFWPSVQDTDVDSIGTVAPGTITRLQTMITAWRAAITSSSWADSPVLFHTISSPPPSVITSWVPATQVATQRRRLRR